MFANRPFSKYGHSQEDGTTFQCFYFLSPWKKTSLSYKAESGWEIYITKNQTKKVQEWVMSFLTSSSLLLLLFFSSSASPSLFSSSSSKLVLVTVSHSNRKSRMRWGCKFGTQNPSIVRDTCNPDPEELENRRISRTCWKAILDSLVTYRPVINPVSKDGRRCLRNST